MPRRLSQAELGILLRHLRRQDLARQRAWQTQESTHLGASARQKPRKSWQKADEKHDSMPRKFLETSITTLGSLLILALGGYTYHIYYKSLVLHKINNAFSSGFSTLELAALAQHGVPPEPGEEPVQDDELRFKVLRPEQSTIDSIVSGKIRGNYYLLFGEKGTGKTTMLLDAMRKVQGSGVAMLEAHSDLEVFRLRLGKALDYEYHEDYVGGLFNIRGPREATPLLDIERALNKLEKVALKRKSKLNKPLTLIINNIHFLPDSAEGQHLLTLLQQRAELWAASELVTLVFTSDEYRTTETLRPHATRMQVLNVRDVPKEVAIPAMQAYRKEKFNETMSVDILSQAYDRVGGRLIFLEQVARSRDLFRMCESICEKEKRWLLSQCWILGAEMDDKAEEQQDYCHAAMILAKALVELENKQVKPKGGAEIPGMPIHKVQELMTRADFLHKLDQMNIFAIDANGVVKADSVPMQNAFRAVVSDPAFEEHLEATTERLDELEGLGRTTELTMKDLVNGQYAVTAKGMGGKEDTTFLVKRM
ncbi:hypothetical protein N8T08_007170 [Aspergillus melleus]|uniref:Uncharacterized protein n=1 Tax=Aspergillus melleus TaxID=138277 RepID=A0ACC3AY62_9EURO|nr:hypothetical protein N8T08_007170 [Aspergillus melleus]